MDEPYEDDYSADEPYPDSTDDSDYGAEQNAEGAGGGNYGGEQYAQAHAGHAHQQEPEGGDDDMEGDEAHSEEEDEDVDAHGDIDDAGPEDEEGGDHDGVEDEGDTTAEQAHRGKDIQGIPWHRLNFSRQKYRETRLRQYKNYENLPTTHAALVAQLGGSDGRGAGPHRRDGNFYSFSKNTRRVKSTIVHFQLRNLVWATSPHDVYTLHRHTVSHYDAITRRSRVALDLGGNVNAVGRVQVSTLCVKHGLLVAGGFGGEVVCRSIGGRCAPHFGRVSRDDNAITNALEIYRSPGSSHHAPKVFACNNDRMVRHFDAETFRCTHSRAFPWAVNHASVSPDGRLACVVGDDPAALLVDTHNNETVATLAGHLDYGFATAWHPNGHLFATGNQDTTCRLWDRRYLGPSLDVFRGRIGAARSLRFSPDGAFLAIAEPADFVHVVDVRKGTMRRCQEIDLFGEVAGVAFAPDSRGESLFVGVSDRTYGSLLEYSRTSRNRLESSAMLAL